jgi:hypothetical protein
MLVRARYWVIGAVGIAEFRLCAKKEWDVAQRSSGDAAILAAWEHRRIIGLRNALRDSGGKLIAEDFMSSAALDERHLCAADHRLLRIRRSDSD